MTYSQTDKVCKTKLESARAATQQPRQTLRLNYTFDRPDIIQSEILMKLCRYKRSTEVSRDEG